MRLNTRRVVLGSVLGVFLAGSGAFAQAPPPDFLKAKEALDAARRAGNSEEWARYTTDDYIGVNAEGTVQTKAERFAAIKANKIASRPQSDFKVRVYGDALIETFTVDGPDGPVRQTGVWVKQNGMWKLANVQQTNAKK